MLRDSEKAESDPMLGWLLYKHGHKLALNHIFTLQNAHKYIHIGTDDQSAGLGAPSVPSAGVAADAPSDPEQRVYYLYAQRFRAEVANGTRTW